MQAASEGPADLADHSRGAPVRLKRRAEFLRVGKGRRWYGKALALQAARRHPVLDAGDLPVQARVGFTLTKKVGCAVIRNRARRRLREAVRLADLPFQPDSDYVIVGRTEAVRLPFEALKQELAAALRSVRTSSDQASGERTRRKR